METYSDRLPLPDGNDLETCTVTGHGLDNLKSYLEAHGFIVTGFVLVGTDAKGGIYRAVGEKVIGEKAANHCPFVVVARGLSCEGMAHA